MHPVSIDKHYTFRSLLARMPTRFLNLELALLRPCFLGFGREPYPNFSFEEIDLYFFFVQSACFCVWVVVRRSPSSEGSFSWNISVMLCTDEHKFINISASVQTYDNVSSLLSAMRTFRPAFSTLTVLACGERLVAYVLGIDNNRVIR